MQILTQGEGGIENYHGTIGAPTSMYDNNGENLFVGDVVEVFTVDELNNLSFHAGIAFVCEEDTSKAKWTGVNQQFVMGIASVYNSDRFKEVFSGVNVDDEEEFWSAMGKINGEYKWRVYKVKNFYDLVPGEKLDGMYVEEICEEK